MIIKHGEIDQMKIIVQNTTKIVELNGVPARVWEGETDTGIKVHCFITRIGVSKDEPNVEQFEKELTETRVPTSDIEGIPTRLIL